MAGARNLIVHLHERVPRRLLPFLQEGVPLRPIIARLRSAALQRRVARVGEGAQHARDVAQRRLFFATFGKRARGLAFEIDNHEIIAGNEHLAKMIVAVHADLERAQLLHATAVDALQERVARAQQCGSLGARGSRQTLDRACKKSEG